MVLGQAQKEGVVIFFAPDEPKDSLEDLEWHTIGWARHVLPKLGGVTTGFFDWRSPLLTFVVRDVRIRRTGAHVPESN